MTARVPTAFRIAARAMMAARFGEGLPDAGPSPSVTGNPAAEPVAAKSIDWIGASLAAILVVAPLLPRGLTYLGWPKLAYVELVVPALFVVWAAGRLTSRHRTPRPSPIPLLPWDLFAAIVAGSTLLGLMADNVVTSPVFGARLLAALHGELFGPLHLTAYPLYSLRAGLTLLEGWLVVRLVIDTCNRAVDPASRARFALAGWGAGFGVAALFAIVQYVTRFHLHPYWVKANPSLVRSHSTLDDPNALGACLVLGLGLLVGLLRLDDRSRRSYWTALFALGFAGLVTSMSRSALGAVVIAPSAVLAFGPPPVTPLQRSIRTSARLLIAGLTVAVVVSMALRAVTPESRRSQPSNPVDMVVKTFDPRESTGWVLRGRLPWWQAAAGMFVERPLTGVGIGRYIRLMLSYGGGKVENTHNFFLQLFAESGVLGGVSFIILSVSVCLAFRRGWQNHWDRRSALALGGLIGVVAFLLTLLTGHTLLVPIGQITFASFVALTTIAAMPQSRLVSVTTPTLRRRIIRAGALLVAFLVAPTSGVMRGVAPQLGDWGYHVGLYEEERNDQGVRYRWTAGEAQLDLTVPEGATGVILGGAVARPIGASPPTRVRVTAGTTTREWLISTSAPQRLLISLTPGLRRVVVTVDVEPTYVPASNGQSHDTRTLGMRLLVPSFEGV